MCLYEAERIRLRNVVFIYKYAKLVPISLVVHIGSEHGDDLRYGVVTNNKRRNEYNGVTETYGRARML